jgi:hypothetical protein
MPPISKQPPKPAPEKNLPTDGVIYPDLTVNGKKVQPVEVDHALAKQLLGWQEETDKVKFGADYLFRDYRGRKIRCLRNLSNRPLDIPTVDSYSVEMLKKNWKLNGETLVIGNKGSAISVQHRLVAIVFAHQKWEGPGAGGLDQSVQWRKIWPDSPPSFPAIIVFGIEETDEVINTVDTGKPRSDADAIYRSDIFAAFPAKERKVLSRGLGYAVKTLWQRTGVRDPISNPRRTHSETFHLVESHPRIVECVKFLNEEYKSNWQLHNNRIAHGIAAAALYLMGSCASDREHYATPKENRHESKLSWEYWDHACEFWSLLCANAQETKALQDAFLRMAQPSDENPTGQVDDRLVLLAKAWEAFKDGGEITPEDLKINYVLRDGVFILNENGVGFGGIDEGQQGLQPVEYDGEEDPPRYNRVVDPTPEEIRERAAEEKRRHLEDMKNGKRVRTR